MSAGAPRQRLPLQQCASGMVVAEEVRDGRGTCLVAQGTALTAPLLVQLAGRGIDHLTVSAAPPSDAAMREAMRQAVEARLHMRFEQVLQRPLMQQLYRLLLNYRMKGG